MRDLVTRRDVVKRRDEQRERQGKEKTVDVERGFGDEKRKDYWKR
jgi:hypothetical protein